MFKIIDNAIEKEQFNDLKLLMFSKHFPWFYSPTVTAESQRDKLFYFTHLFYQDYSKNSEYFNLLLPILAILKPNAIVRIKGNLYPNLGKKVQNDFHEDFEYSHKNALFYINDNNGPTVFKSGQKVESKENRLLIFDSKKAHASTYCSDEKVRININFNYF
jgi:hypothetical protein|tara:strand:- start:466 stop:948 length:483 start_codon:yes stop_codon:yes gene_type:complete